MDSALVRRKNCVRHKTVLFNFELGSMLALIKVKVVVTILSVRPGVELCSLPDAKRVCERFGLQPHVCHGS